MIVGERVPSSSIWAFWASNHAFFGGWVGALKSGCPNLHTNSDPRDTDPSCIFWSFLSHRFKKYSTIPYYWLLLLKYVFNQFVNPKHQGVSLLSSDWIFLPNLPVHQTWTSPPVHETWYTPEIYHIYQKIWFGRCISFQTWLCWVAMLDLRGVHLYKSYPFQPC